MGRQKFNVIKLKYPELYGVKTETAIKYGLSIKSDKKALNCLTKERKRIDNFIDRLIKTPTKNVHNSSELQEILNISHYGQILREVYEIATGKIKADIPQSITKHLKKRLKNKKPLD